MNFSITGGPVAVVAAGPVGDVLETSDLHDAQGVPLEFTLMLSCLAASAGARAVVAIEDSEASFLDAVQVAVEHFDGPQDLPRTRAWRSYQVPGVRLGKVGTRLRVNVLSIVAGQGVTVDAVLMV